jgi:hypothetical protein
MSDMSYAERLRETIERKIRLRGVFTSRALIEDNEREIRKAHNALRAVEATLGLSVPPAMRRPANADDGVEGQLATAN